MPEQFARLVRDGQIKAEIPVNPNDTIEFKTDANGNVRIVVGKDTPEAEPVLPEGTGVPAGGAEAEPTPEPPEPEEEPKKSPAKKTGARRKR